MCLCVWGFESHIHPDMFIGCVVFPDYYLDYVARFLLPIGVPNYHPDVSLIRGAIKGDTSNILGEFAGLRYASAIGIDRGGGMGGRRYYRPCAGKDREGGSYNNAVIFELRVFKSGSPPITLGPRVSFRLSQPYILFGCPSAVGKWQAADRSDLRDAHFHGRARTPSRRAERPGVRYSDPNRRHWDRTPDGVYPRYG